MKPLDRVALGLVIIGALNWALVGIAKFDLVATLVGKDFGETNVISRIIYLLVGLSGVWLLTLLVRDESKSPSRA
jgi:uncharacterized membrane protein YuzA (DUF378 family)